jgi:hypothetical protein
MPARQSSPDCFTGSPRRNRTGPSITDRPRASCVLPARSLRGFRGHAADLAATGTAAFTNQPAVAPPSLVNVLRELAVPRDAFVRQVDVAGIPSNQLITVFIGGDGHHFRPEQIAFTGRRFEPDERPDGTMNPGVTDDPTPAATPTDLANGGEPGNWIASPRWLPARDIRAPQIRVSSSVARLASSGLNTMGPAGLDWPRGESRFGGRTEPS